VETNENGFNCTILVIGQECIGRDEGIELNARSCRVLDEVAKLWRELSSRSRIVIPGGWIRGNTVMHSEPAKRYLVELHLVPEDLISIPFDNGLLEIAPSRCLTEDLESLPALGPSTLVVCEALQAPRVWLTAHALGCRHPRIVPVWSWNGISDAFFYQLPLAALYLLDPLERFVRTQGIVKKYRGRRYPWGNPPQIPRRNS
jgi:hypothetical protein